MRHFFEKNYPGQRLIKKYLIEDSQYQVILLYVKNISREEQVDTEPWMIVASTLPTLRLLYQNQKKEKIKQAVTKSLDRNITKKV